MVIGKKLKKVLIWLILGFFFISFLITGKNSPALGATTYLEVNTYLFRGYPPNADFFPKFEMKQTTDWLMVNPGDTIDHIYHFDGAQKTINYTSPQFIQDRTAIDKFKNQDGTSPFFSSISSWILVSQHPNANNIFYVVDNFGKNKMFLKEGDKYFLIASNTNTGHPLPSTHEYEYAGWFNKILEFTMQTKTNPTDIVLAAAAFKNIENLRISSSEWPDSDCAKPPEITIPEDYGIGGTSLRRPAVTFKLTHVMGRSGTLTWEDNFFYFLTTQFPDAGYDKVALRINNEGAAWFVWYNDIENWRDDTPLRDQLLPQIGSQLKIDQDVWLKFINKAYNETLPYDETLTGDKVCGKVTTKDEVPTNYTDGEVPNKQCVNVDDNGWLVGCWHVTYSRSSLTNPAGAETCGLPITKIGTPEYWIAQALCGILNLIADLGEMIIRGLFYTIFNAYHPPDHQRLAFLTAGFSIHKAYAASTLEDTPVSPLNQAFTNTPNKWAWVITVWKFCLGLTDLFLVVILLFLGIVNILHIQYDTYAIKKALPLLIIGVILANFSLLIMRMMIDVSNILTQSFMGGKDPGTAVHDLIVDFGLSKNQLPAFASGWTTVGGLFLAIFFSFFVIAGFIILGVMFYIRYAAILLLGMIAPLAFVCLAFPPTQSLFKQWWGWATKFIFMKPIAMFLIMVATKAKGSGAGTGITGWMIITALVYMAILVPWKLGGAVMAMWGGAMGTLFGTKKGGWARKPVDNWWERRKNRFGSFLIKTFPGLAGRAEWDKENTELQRKKAIAKAKRYREGQMGGRQARERRLAQEAEEDLKRLQETHMLGVETGKLRQKLGLLGNLRFWLTTGVRNEGDLARRFAQSTAAMQKAVEAANKSRSWDLFTVLGRDQRNNQLLRKNFKDMLLQQGIGLSGIKLNEEDGSISFEDDQNPKLTYADYDENKMEALRREKTESDPEKRRRLHEGAMELQRRQLEFQRLHPSFRDSEGKTVNLNYDDFLDKNLNGRILKLLTPPLIEEQKTFEQNENLQGFLKMLNQGGGFGEVTCKQEELLDFINRRYTRFKRADPIFAAQSILGGYKGKMAGNPDTTNAQEFFAELVEFLQKNLKNEQTGEEFWPTLLRSLEDQASGGSTGTLANFATEFSSWQKSRGETPIIPDDVIERCRKEKGRIIASDLYKLMPVDEIINRFPVDKARELILTSGDYRTRFQRDFFRKVRAKIEGMEELGGGANPANFGGEVEDGKVFESLKPKGGWTYNRPGGAGTVPIPTSTPSAGTGPGIPPPPSAVAAEQESQARILWESTGPSQILRQVGRGSYTQTALTLGGGADYIIEMRNDLADRLIPPNVRINPQSLNAVIGRLSEVDVNLPLAEIENQLKQISPEIKLDPTLSVSDYVSRAQKVTQGTQNYVALAENAQVEERYPYAQAAPKDDAELRNALAELRGATETLADAASQFLVSGGKQTIPDEGIQKVIGAIEKARGNDTKLNLDSLRNGLKNNEFSRVSDVVSKLFNGLEANQRVKNLQQPVNEFTLKRALSAAFRESLTQQPRNEYQPPGQPPAQPAAPGGEAAGPAAGEETTRPPGAPEPGAQG